VLIPSGGGEFRVGAVDQGGQPGAADGPRADTGRVEQVGDVGGRRRLPALALVPRATTKCADARLQPLTIPRPRAPAVPGSNRGRSLDDPVGNTGVEEHPREESR